MTVTICGIPYKVIKKQDSFTVDASHFGEINFKLQTIFIADDLSPDVERETLVHEIIHGILFHLGYNELNDDESKVQGLANAINRTFTITQ